MCFSLGMIEYALIWLVIVCAVVAVLRIFVPWILGVFGVVVDGRVMQILNIIIAAIVLIYFIILVFDLLSCLVGGGVGLRR